MIEPTWTPVEREAMQLAILREWLARTAKKRADNEGDVTKHYRTDGMLIGLGTTRHAPRLTTLTEDRAPLRVAELRPR